MAVFNTFTFDGENSLDYGVYITGEAVYNAPERAVEMVSIPGKNGALALDQGRFENIEVTYPAGTFGAEQAEFAGRMRAMRNMLASRYNYVRLTDTYHPDEYRLGLYKSGLEATPVAMSSAGEFDITFNCKPQRFLTSGEEPVDTSELGGEVTTDKIPYLFRRSGGGNIGHDFDAEIDKIIGGTVAWNQLFSARMATVTLNGVTVTNNNDGSFTVQGTATANSSFRLNQSTVNAADHLDTYYAGRKYLFLGNDGVRLTIMQISTWSTFALTLGVGIVTSNQTLDNCFVYMSIGSGVTLDKKITPQIIDLTQAFGTEIADYVYSLEQTTAGAGVAWLKSHGLLTKDYHAYNKGSLLSVKTSEHRTTGKNLIPMSINNIKSINTEGTWSGNAYTRNGITFTLQIDGDGNITGIKANGTASGSDGTLRLHTGSLNIRGTFILSGGISTDAWVFIANVGQSNVTDFTFTTTGINATVGLAIRNGKTVNNLTFYPMIRWASVSDATYEPYESHSYPLDSDLELRGLFKLDANNNLYADGDVYPPSGEVTHRFAEVSDVSTIVTRTAYEGSVNKTVVLNTPSLSKHGSDKMCLASKYIYNGTVWGTDALSDPDNMAVGVYAYYASAYPQYDNTFYVVLAKADSVSGSMIYELATPTTEQADPYANPQIVNPLGTEEYVDTRDVPVPVGHETRYGMRQLILTNSTEFPSKPLLEVTGVGTFWLGDTLFTITGTAGQTIYIDCETGEAWKNVGGIITPANGLVTLNRLDFPELDPGETPVIYGTGITKVVVTPRWWII